MLGRALLERVIDLKHFDPGVLEKRIASAREHAHRLVEESAESVVRDLELARRELQRAETYGDLITKASVSIAGLVEVPGEPQTRTTVQLEPTGQVYVNRTSALLEWLQREGKIVIPPGRYRALYFLVAI